MKTTWDKNVRFVLLILKIAWFIIITDNNNNKSNASGLIKNNEIPENCNWDSDTKISCIYYNNDLISNNNNENLINFNFSQTIRDEITSLNIICKNNNDKITSTTIIDNFSYLWKLRELNIIGCKFINLPIKLLDNFINLKNLTIKSSNNNRRSKIIIFNLPSGIFNMTPFIEKIDLSFNNIWQLPESVFCQLSNLIYLNLSWNSIKDVREFSFHNDKKKDKCLLDVQSLDVSNNQILVLPAFGFSALKRLKLLNVSGNAISVVDDSALYGLRSLEIFDVSSNKIVALPATMFNDARNTIKELWLQNNSMRALAPGLVIEMSQLVSLDLSINSLTSTWLNPSTFAGLIRLVLLNLSWNKISTIDPALFKDLYTLQILNLQYNQIQTIPSNTFLPMSNLHTLNLAHNKLKSLEAHSLNGLYAVSLVSLDSNQLENINEDAFANCSSMQDLNLSGNYFESIPSALKNMRMLKTLDIGENKIKNLTYPGFHGMSSLYGLRLIGNSITNITNNDFIQLPALQILNLSHNKISTIQSMALSKNRMLQAIRLDMNNLQNISGIFTDTPSLIWLNISDNMITSLEYSYLPEKIQWLDIHKNRINHLGIAPRNSHLQSFDISFNKLTKIHPNSLPDSIQLLLMNNNLLKTIEPQTFHDKENLTRVDLYANHIVKMDFSVFHLGRPSTDNRKLPEFYIGGNPFICDCTMEWLQRINSLQVRKHPKIMDLDTVYCRLPYNRYHSYVPLMEAKSSQFLCTYTAHCFALCHCCDFDACDCEMTCPTNCTCYHDESWAANVVDCSNSGYKYLPECLPMDATEVYLDGNDYDELISHSFIGRKNLQILYTNNSNIRTIHNHTFSGLKRLTILHLENNKITHLSGVEFVPLENLKELYLQNNLLSHIDNRSFITLRHLEVLSIQGNKLRTFELWQLASNPYLVEISISSNPWSCHCPYMEQVFDWLINNRDKIQDWKLLSCNNALPVTLLNNASKIDCSLFSETSTIGNQQLGAYLPLTVFTVILLIVIVVLIITGIKHRVMLKNWIANKCGFRMCYKTAAGFEDSEKPFDAYISYSAIDEMFVSQVLVPGLSSYRLCLHYRNISTGANLTDAVTEAADSSKRTILILSQNFINGEWTRFEFKTALNRALKRKGRSVILLCIGGVSFDDLDNDLKKRISQHTVIVWGDKLFWQKLKFAMPDILLPVTVVERPLSLPASPISLMHQALWT